MSKVIQSWWFTSIPHFCIGIVKVKNIVGEYRFYIGVCGGYDQEKDEEFIKNYGIPFDPKMFEVE